MDIFRIKSPQNKLDCKNESMEISMNDVRIVFERKF